MSRADRWEALLDILPARITPEDIAYSAPDNSDQPTPARFRTLRFVRDRHGHVVRRGQGAHGVVVEAVVDDDATHVAVKIFHGGDEDGPRREWELGQTDHGRHVVRSFALHTVTLRSGWQVQMLVMRLVAGPTLNQLIHASTPVPKPLQARWLRQGLGALVSMSEITELRDIKPANIGLTSVVLDEAELVLLDHSQGKVSGMSTGGLRQGTQAYAAPEYIFGASSRRSDVFSLGATLLDTFLQGEGFPTRPESPMHGIPRTCTEAPRLGDERLDRHVAHVLSGALVKRHLDRPAASTLLQELEHPSETPRNWDPDAPVATRHDLEALPQEAPAAPTLPPQQPPIEGPPPNDRTEPIDPIQERHRARPAQRADPPRALPYRVVHTLPLPQSPAQVRRWPALGRENWLVRITGIDPRMVEVHSERVLYSIAGVLLAVYAVYATVATTALFHLTTGATGTDLWPGVAAGTVIAAVVVGVDRIIISTVPVKPAHDPNSGASPLGKHGKAAMGVRVGIALLFALVIMEPANLMVFDRDVDAAIANRVDDDVEPAVERIETEYATQREEQREVISSAEERKAMLQEQPDKLHALAEEEAAGDGATGAASCGEMCETYLEQEQTAREGLTAALAAQDGLIADASAHLDTLRTQEATEIDEVTQRFAADDGFFAREKVLWSMLGNDRLMLARYLMIAALLLLFEMAGVLAKLVAKGNTYEHKTALRIWQTRRDGELAAAQLQRLAERHGEAQERVARWREQGNLELLWLDDQEHYNSHDVHLRRD